jgi:hypothetical protein
MLMALGRRGGMQSPARRLDVDGAKSSCLIPATSRQQQRASKQPQLDDTDRKGSRPMKAEKIGRPSV